MLFKVVLWATTVIVEVTQTTRVLIQNKSLQCDLSVVFCECGKTSSTHSKVLGLLYEYYTVVQIRRLK